MTRIITNRHLAMKKSVKGFTLVEILIAVLITSFLGAVIFSVFSQGVRLWDRAYQQRSNFDIYYFVEKLNTDLQNSFIFSNDDFIGKPNSMEFYSLAPDQHFKSDLPVKVQYSLQGSSVNRQELSYEKVLAGNKQGFSQVLLDRISSCQFQYYFTDFQNVFEWMNYWQKDCLPSAVKILIEYRENNKTHQRSDIVWLPQGGCP